MQAGFRGTFLNEQPRAFNGKIVVSTGELSGEIHASHLVEALKERVDAAFSGMGSDRLKEAGVEIIHDYRDISVTGITEVLSKLPEIRKAYTAMKRHLLFLRPSLLILVDYPGFNLRLAALAKRHGIPVIYFIPPQVWAWRKRRIKTIKETVGRVISILPFEKAFYDASGIDAVYVGHPFVETVRPSSTREEFRNAAGLKGTGPVITLMPGSRQNEIRKHLPIMLEAAERIRHSFPGMEVLLPVAPSVPFRFVEAMVPAHAGVILLRGLSHDALSASDLAIIASGSASLEAALLGTPSIVIYRVSRLSYRIARLLVDVEYISLPNLIADREVFPELIQNLTANDVADKAIYVLNKGVADMRRGMEEVRQRLGSPGSYRLATASIVQFLEGLYGTLPETP